MKITFGKGKKEKTIADLWKFYESQKLPEGNTVKSYFDNLVLQTHRPDFFKSINTNSCCYNTTEDIVDNYNLCLQHINTCYILYADPKASSLDFVIDKILVELEPLEEKSSIDKAVEILKNNINLKQVTNDNQKILKLTYAPQCSNAKVHDNIKNIFMLKHNLDTNKVQVSWWNVLYNTFTYVNMLNCSRSYSTIVITTPKKTEQKPNCPDKTNNTEITVSSVEEWNKEIDTFIRDNSS